MANDDIVPTLNWGLLYNKFFMTFNPYKAGKENGKDKDKAYFFNLMLQGKMPNHKHVKQPRVLTVGPPKELFNAVQNAVNSNQDDGLNIVCQRYQARQKSLVTSLLKQTGLQHIEMKDVIRTMTCSWRFVNGLSIPHLLGVNLLWHPTLGIPYLPGSALKGILKSFLTDIYADEDTASANDPAFTEMMQRVFGREVVSDREVAEAVQEQQAGDYIFFDALPTKKMKFVVDIMTPHFRDWYTQGNQSPGQLNNTPNDWHDPVPISFLALEDFDLQLTVVPRPGAQIVDSDELKFIMDMLCHALSHQGAGAKTALGYGYFQSRTDKN
ncbi:type III-B CRISPR module RAMP protein Cmr6 [Vibrio gazogenes]|uniref:RAMP superfamily protein n=1 Tax=Vibrio gazogenes DSM 21264 = NBRC 103151 TaxID=1123492 RepID=A0A1M4VCX7_VIBGA|nr:type III-B CRISPR module RAMP protein Cmr6 [Vibrio gazogenes]USP15575.1 type III-B CRISPR module RAMP protein Cmr6 [Vibrio gazogenes]SHE66680.1 RAMP superfamily protein [Vibrio gazogenes DSM 21264] [Vibrio gazogenes DSM 21264 = NBRC 103151]SJN57104.1 hypothetical protein BQ6471_02383 [Vibrio gazogenes]